MTNIDLTGKQAMIIGGGIGIGSAIAIQLAACGADVALTTLTHDASQTVEKIHELGRRAYALNLDATDSAAVARVMADVAEHTGGHIDILVNNAGGLVGRSTVAELDDDLLRRIFEVNVFSAFYCTRAVLPYMTSGWGRIINNGSVAGHHGGGIGAATYGAAKGAIHTLTRGLAKEVAHLGITVNAVAPGFIAGTPFHETFTSAAAQETMIAQTPLRRAGASVDVAGAVAFLSSDLASFITGEVIEINGGLWFA
jgi:3-oxoacyl-[acyl-carrier protein] reductase